MVGWGVCGVCVGHPGPGGWTIGQAEAMGAPSHSAGHILSSKWFGGLVGLVPLKPGELCRQLLNLLF